MMNLLRKELRLSMHQTMPIFLTLTALILIPSYPYYVTFFYGGLAVFFTSLTGRENHDVQYMMTLPVKRRDIVAARILFVVLYELLLTILAVPFAILRSTFPVPANEVGMEANVAFFGLSLILMGLFNMVFFLCYFRDIQKVGKSFLLASSAVWVFIILAETAAHIVPLFRDRLDTPDPLFMAEKLATLGIGVVIFAVATLLTYRSAARSFERLDL